MPQLRVRVELDRAAQPTDSLAEEVDLREWVRLAGQEEGRAADVRKMGGACRGAVWRAGRVEREREQDQRGVWRRWFRRREAGHTATVGMAADDRRGVVGNDAVE